MHLQVAVITLALATTPQDNYNVRSFPTLLFSWCASRRAALVEDISLDGLEECGGDALPLRSARKTRIFTPHGEVDGETISLWGFWDYLIQDADGRMSSNRMLSSQRKSIVLARWFNGDVVAINIFQRSLLDIDGLLKTAWESEKEICEVTSMSYFTNAPSLRYYAAMLTCRSAMPPLSVATLGNCHA